MLGTPRGTLRCQPTSPSCITAISATGTPPCGGPRLSNSPMHCPSIPAALDFAATDKANALDQRRATRASGPASPRRLLVFEPYSGARRRERVLVPQEPCRPGPVPFGYASVLLRFLFSSSGCAPWCADHSSEPGADSPLFPSGALSPAVAAPSLLDCSEPVTCIRSASRHPKARGAARSPPPPSSERRGTLRAMSLPRGVLRRT